MSLDTRLQEQVRLDVELIQRITARDASAVALLYDRHSTLLYNLVLRIVQNTGDAEEVLQDVFVTIWNKGNTYDESLGSPVAWLLRIARNRAIDRLRRGTTRDRVLLSPQVPPPQDTPEQLAVRREQQAVVCRALAALAETQRRLIEDAYFMGLTHVELAERHALPLGTVKSRIRQGMEALRHSLSSVEQQS